MPSSVYTSSMEMFSALPVWRVKSIVLTLFCLGALSHPAIAQGEPLDVRLLVDVSDRMSRADPQQVRAGAIDLLVQLLPEEAYAGIWC